MSVLAPDVLWLLLLVPVMLLLEWRWSLVDRPLGRRWGAAALRLLALALLILAAARPLLRLPTEAVHTVHLLDVSGSIDLQAVRERLQALPEADPEQQLFLLADGAEPSDHEGARQRIAAWRDARADDGFRHATRIGGAAARARLAFPADARKRLVIHSDGIATDSDCWPRLQALTGEGIAVQRAPLPGLSEPEVAVLRFAGNRQQVHDGDQLRFQLALRSTVDQPATLRLLADGILLHSQSLQLRADATRDLAVDLPAAGSGRIRYSVEIQAQQDRYPFNNQRFTSVEVLGRPRILALHRQPESLRNWRRALDQQGITVEARGEQGLPRSLAGLLAFDAIVLADVPATAFSATQLDLLRRYVHEAGGGLAMLGSENSFGLGGYYRSAVESVLPLRSRYEKQEEEPSLGLVLVIDKSGSMQGDPIDQARAAAIAAVELLSQRDSAGVVAFDGSAWLVSRLRSMLERELVIGAIGGLEASGGTNLAPGLEQAYQLLDGSSCRLQHVLVLSDGMSQAGNHEGLVQAMANAGMTVSTIALGDGADTQLMTRLAQIGGGRYYRTVDPRDMPRIFTKETMTAARSAIREDLIDVLPVQAHPLLGGQAPELLPPLFGYVMTRLRPTAELLLATDSGDPLLAYGRFGLGASLAFTSDVGAAWADEWQAWDGFDRFWAQALRGIIRREQDPGIQITSELSAEGDSLSLHIDQLDRDGVPVDDSPWQASFIDNSDDNLPFRQTGPGRYRLRTPVPQDASLRIHDPASGFVRIQHLERAYPREYHLQREPDPAWQALPDWQHATTLPAAGRSHELAPWLLAVALISLLLGVLLRRL